MRARWSKRSASIKGSDTLVRPGGKAWMAGAVSALALIASGCVTGPTPEELQMMDWQQAARLDTPPAYATYLRVYPDGLYAGNARARIDELGRMEADAFADARRADTEDAYAAFVQRWPWGVHAADATSLRDQRAAPRLARQENADWTDAQ